MQPFGMANTRGMPLTVPHDTSNTTIAVLLVAVIVMKAWWSGDSGHSNRMKTSGFGKSTQHVDQSEWERGKRAARGRGERDGPPSKG